MEVSFVIYFFFSLKKTYHEMSIRYWSTVVCATDLGVVNKTNTIVPGPFGFRRGDLGRLRHSRWSWWGSWPVRYCGALPGRPRPKNPLEIQTIQGFSRSGGARLLQQPHQFGPGRRGIGDRPGKAEPGALEAASPAAAG